MNKKILKQTIKRIIPKKKEAKVSLFLVGAQKAGTSALHNYLIKHKEIQGGVQKELNFFNYQENFEQGTTFYHSKFKPVLCYKHDPIRIDSTPQYLMDNEIAKKIHNYNPNSKIVILLREPTSRAFSAWNMYKQFSELNIENKKKLIANNISISNEKKFKKLIDSKPFISFDEFVDRELNNSETNGIYPNILRRGVYVDQVKAYLDCFGVNNVMVFESNYFRNNKVEVTNKILNALGLSGLQIKDDQLKDVHTRTYENSIKDDNQKRLIDFYKPYNEKLFKLINQRFDW
ncbi:sulfotransferase domain-containing protein [Winogradskyella vidalii]|uniref:sulfotransferase domain-containing protein n=1 Tax=Winogradskyella vidalii TaxID=2615024 RepID=UPI0015CB3965|nr:sulfotransferase domain-containing protein [Winogradskyella vidalii]